MRCAATRYTSQVIQRFRTKSLERLHHQNSTRGVPQDQVKRLKRILHRLDKAIEPGDMNVHGWHLEPLKGNRAGQWSVRVTGNWRVVFRFENGHATDVEHVDYH